MQEGDGDYFKIIIQKVKGNIKSYAIPDFLMLHTYRLKALNKLLYFCKDGGSFLFISKWFYNSGVVQVFFED